MSLNMSQGPLRCSMHVLILKGLNLSMVSILCSLPFLPDRAVGVFDAMITELEVSKTIHCGNGCKTATV